MEFWVGAGLACVGIAVGLGQWLIPPDVISLKIRAGLIVLACSLALIGGGLIVYAVIPHNQVPIVNLSTTAPADTAKPSELAPLTKLEPKKDAEKQQKEIPQENSRKNPELKGTIEAMMTGLNKDKTVGAFLFISITNIGEAPSIAEGWRVVVRYDGLTVTADPIYIDEGLKILRADGMVVKEFHRSNAIEEVTSTAIGPGDKRQGWAQYRLKGLPSDFRNKAGTKWTIHFRDVRNRKYTGVYTSDGTPLPPIYIPGFGDPLKNLP